MRKVYLLIIVIFITTNKSYNQDYLLIFDNYNSSYNYDWRGIAKRYTYKSRLDFIEYCKENQLLISEYSFYESNPGLKRFLDNLTVADLNGDQKEDFIYYGSSGGEANIIKFFINTENGFEKRFEVNQGIVKVIWNDTKIEKIFTHDWGCCDDNRIINHVFIVDYDNKNIPTFNKVYQSIELEFMTKPLIYFENPIKFNVDNDNYKLRFSPNLDDSTYFESDINRNRLGNVIGFLNKGTIGKAYAAKEDENGRIWWYVEINPNYEIKNNLIYMRNLDYPTHVIGWLSSRYLTQMD